MLSAACATDSQVAIGDLTKEPCCAIVNAANSKLAHGGGLARSIAKASGGGAVTAQSKAWVQRHGLVPTGGVAWTEANTLSKPSTLNKGGAGMPCCPLLPLRIGCTTSEA